MFANQNTAILYVVSDVRIFEFHWFKKPAKSESPPIRIHDFRGSGASHVTSAELRAELRQSSKKKSVPAAAGPAASWPARLEAGVANDQSK